MPGGGGGGVHSYQLDISGIAYDSLITVPTIVTAVVCDEDCYHYGYNGQMKTNEWARVGNHYEYKFREYDSRTAKFISVDPLTQKFPYLTPYQFASNSPIALNELEGLEGSMGISGSATVYQDGRSHIEFDQTGDYIPDYNSEFWKANLWAWKRIAGGTAFAGGYYWAYRMLMREFMKEEPLSEKSQSNPQTKVQKPNAGSVRSSNKLKPNEEAEGDHTTYQRGKDGKIDKYETYEKTKTEHYNPVKRYDGKGGSHINKVTGEDVPTPHVHGKEWDPNIPGAGDKIPGGVRPVNPNEIPGGTPAPAPSAPAPTPSPSAPAQSTPPPTEGSWRPPVN